MILERLYKYAVDNKLDPFCDARPVYWTLVIGAKGKLEAVRQEGTIDDKKRHTADAVIMPRAARRSSNIAPSFLADNSQYTLGFSVDENGKRSETLEHRQAFAGLLKKAAEETADPLLERLAAFYDALADKSLVDHPLTRALPIKGGQLISFEFADGKGHLRITDHKPALAWWRGRYGRDGESADVEEECLVTGEKAPVMRIHPAVHIRGASPGGNALVSFNDESSWSHGRKQGENVPISRKAAVRYTIALDHLLEHSSIVLPGDLTVVLIPHDPKPEEDFSDIMRAFGDVPMMPDDQQIRDVYDAPAAGHEPAAPVGGCSVLVLSAVQGRIAIHSFWDDELARVRASLKQYFDDLAMVHPVTHEIVRQFPLKRVWYKDAEGNNKSICGLLDAVTGKTGLTQDVIIGMTWAALDARRPFPPAILQQLLARCRIGIYHRDGKDDPRLVAMTRMALFRGYLARHLRRSDVLARRWRAVDPEFKEIPSMLDENCAVPSYLLGRLLAVMESIQSAASQSVGVSIADRHYAAMSARPGMTFPTTLKASRYHLAKLRRKKPGFAIFWEKKMQAILSKLDQQVGLPKVFGSEDQGLFALGYYQQREMLFRKKDEEVKEEEVVVDN